MKAFILIFYLATSWGEIVEHQEIMDSREDCTRVAYEMMFNPISVQRMVRRPTCRPATNEVTYEINGQAS